MALVMDSVCDHLFTRTGFAEDEDIRVRFGDVLDYLVDVLHRPRAADDAFVRVSARQFCPQFLDLSGLFAVDHGLPFGFDRVADVEHQVLEIKRLHAIAEGTDACCFDRLLRPVVAGDDDDLGIRRDKLCLLDEVDAVDIRQVKVRENNVELVGLYVVEALDARDGRRRFKAFVLKLKTQEVECNGIVVDYKCLSPIECIY